MGQRSNTETIVAILAHTLGCVLLVACRQTASAVVVDAQADVVTAVASAPPPTKPNAPPSPREVVDSWNDAHVKHDARALEALYAAQVDFYGQHLSARACAAKKAAAFAKSPSYTQSIKDVKIETDSGVSIVKFIKTSTENGKSKEYPSELVLAAGAIIGETDDVTQAHLDELMAQDAKGDLWCLNKEWMPNDRIVAPYKISASDAYMRARWTKHFQDQSAIPPRFFIDFGQFGCPTKCVVTGTIECGYRLRLEDHSPAMMNNLDPHSNMIEWVWVDAITAVLYWDDGAHSEPLPTAP